VLVESVRKGIYLCIMCSRVVVLFYVLPHGSMTLMLVWTHACDQTNLINIQLQLYYLLSRTFVLSSWWI